MNLLIRTPESLIKTMRLFAGAQLLRAPRTVNKITFNGISTTLPACSTNNQQKQKSNTSSSPYSKPDDLPVIKFKNMNVKQTMKDLYKLYGPLFIACHITISLTSVGFWCGVVYLSVDPLAYIPQSILIRLGENSSLVSGGSKFAIAYAIHKITLPIRLMGSIYAVRKLAPKVKNWSFKK